MKKALLLAITALSLFSCNTNALKGSEANDSQKIEWRNDADSISIYSRFGSAVGSYLKDNLEELWYKLESECSITIKTIGKGDMTPYEERTLTKLYSNVTYVITFKEAIGEGE